MMTFDADHRVIISSFNILYAAYKNPILIIHIKESSNNKMFH